MNKALINNTAIVEISFFCYLESPPSGRLKVSFDGSSTRTDGEGSSGFMARDHLGWVVRTRSLPHTWIY